MVSPSAGRMDRGQVGEGEYYESRAEGDCRLRKDLNSGCLSCHSFNVPKL